MKNKYSAGVLKIIYEAVLPYCDQITQVAYYKKYKFVITVHNLRPIAQSLSTTKDLICDP